jgi:hypothetical protein
MDDIGRTLDEVCALIGRFPHCSAVSGSVDGEHAVIHLAGKPAELIALQDLIEAANAGVTPWLRADESYGAMATQVVRALVTRRDDLIAHGSLQLVGIHVVWRLHRDGLMGTSEANDYLLRWRAAPVQ